MAKKKKEWIFVRGANPSVVWDPAANKPLAEFADPITKRITGFFATTNEKVAEKLLDLGYREQGDFPEGAPSGGFEPIEQPVDLSAPGAPAPSKKPDLVEKEDEVKQETVNLKPKSIRRGK